PLADPADQLEVVAAAAAVGVDARHEQLAAPAPGRLLGPLHRVDPGRLHAAARVRPPAAVAAGRVHGDDDTLAAQAFRQLVDQLRRAQGGGVHGDLVG